MKWLFIPFAMAAAMLLASCKSDESRVREVAYGYLDATGNYLIDQAMPYATRETREQTLPFLRDKLMPITDSAYIASNTPAQITIDSVTMGTDTAWVHYTKSTPLLQLQNAIQVVKEDGQWLVNVPLVLPENILGGENVTITQAPGMKQ